MHDGRSIVHLQLALKRSWLQGNLAYSSILGIILYVLSLMLGDL